MDSVLRALAVYVFLLVVLRFVGRRVLAELTGFDFILLIIISEAVQQAMMNGDNSMTNAFLVVLTLLGANIGLSLLKERSRRLEKLLDGVPTVIVADGQPLAEVMQRARVDEADVLQAARQPLLLARLDQIQYAILERTDGISVIPKDAA